MTIGSLMLDIEGTELSSEDEEILSHPLTGGIILFTRNFESQKQVQELCSSIRKTAGKNILIAVDQEGGRVQRFHKEYTTLPAMGQFKNLGLSESETLDKLNQTGWLMAAELIASGIDISFAPVLDVDSGISTVIGDRGFSAFPQQIINYSSAFIQGMSKAGMSATGKHFPGHGSTKADSHFELPVDNRTIKQIRELDLSVFVALCNQGLAAIMPAHVIYPEVDSTPACFSTFWLQTILRKELNFNGTIFSDDLSMAGAKVLGDVTTRAKEASKAGCDMILCCNDRNASIELLDNLPQEKNIDSMARIDKMSSKSSAYSFEELQQLKSWQDINAMLIQLND
jgi:beta-N-acetylhexosaminidase